VPDWDVKGRSWPWLYPCQNRDAFDLVGFTPAFRKAAVVGGSAKGAGGWSLLPLHPRDKPQIPHQSRGNCRYLSRDSFAFKDISFNSKHNRTKGSKCLHKCCGMAVNLLWFLLIQKLQVRFSLVCFSLSYGLSVELH